MTEREEFEACLKVATAQVDGDGDLIFYSDMKEAKKYEEMRCFALSLDEAYRLFLVSKMVQSMK